MRPLSYRNQSTDLLCKSAAAESQRGMTQDKVKCIAWLKALKDGHLPGRKG